MNKMTLEEELISNLAEGRIHLEKALLVISGCDTWEKLYNYKIKIDELDSRFKKYLEESGLKDSDSELKKAYALHRFLWNRCSRKNYALARIEDRLLRLLSILPPFSAVMLWPAIGKYKDNEYKLSDVVDNYLAEKTKTGNCLGLTALYTVLALKNGIEAEVVLQPGHILSSIEANGKTMLIENTERYGFNIRIHKLGRWKKNGIETLVASEAHSAKVDAQEEQKDAYHDIEYFADPEYHVKDYNRDSKWQRLLAKAAGLFKRSRRINAKNAAKDTARNYYHRGNHLAERFQLEKAIADYTKAIEHDEKHFGAFCERGVLNYKIGNIAEAISDLTNALELNPISERSAYYRGNARMKTGNYKGAIEDYTIAIDFCETLFHEYYIKRARAYRANGEYDKSKQDFIKAEELQMELSSIDTLKSEYQ